VSIVGTDELDSTATIICAPQAVKGKCAVRLGVV